jgi:hypothetical protein
VASVASVMSDLHKQLTSLYPYQLLLAGIDQAVTTLQAKWLGNLGSTPCSGGVIFHAPNLVLWTMQHHIQSVQWGSFPKNKAQEQSWLFNSYLLERLQMRVEIHTSGSPRLHYNLHRDFTCNFTSCILTIPF